MSTGEEDLKLTAQTESILERLRRLEVQVGRLVDSQTVEAKEFVVLDERGQPRARFEMAGHSPQLVFYNRLGKERLRIGLHSDGTPAMWVEDREIPFVIPENRG
jgi:hypothetical protein